MGYKKNVLLVAATMLLVVLAKELEAQYIGEDIAERFINVTEKFDQKAALGGEGNVIINLATEALQLIDDLASFHASDGSASIPEAIKILKDGWQLSLKMISNALDQISDFIDNLLEMDILDSEAELANIADAMVIIQKEIFHSGSPIHSSLGAAKSITNKTDIKAIVDKAQECGSPIFDGLEAAQYFAIQALSVDNIEVSRKYLKAARSVIQSAARAINVNLVAAVLSAFEYFDAPDKVSTISLSPIEDTISIYVREAAAADSNTVAAIKTLDEELVNAKFKDVNPDILDELTGGLFELIELCSLSIAQGRAKIIIAKDLAEVNPEAAVNAIRDAIKSAKSIFIDGTAKAYAGLGAAGYLSGLINGFQAVIEIIEKTSIEGTKAMDVAEKIAAAGIQIGETALDKAIESALLIFEAAEAHIFEKLLETIYLSSEVLSN